MSMPYSIDLKAIQAPLKESYRTDPKTALVTTSAKSVPSDLSDPRHCAVAPVEYSSVVIRSGLHPAAGGAGDTPCSGDILAAALAICEGEHFEIGCGQYGHRAGGGRCAGGHRLGFQGHDGH